MVIASKIALPEGNLELVVPLLSYLGMWLAVIWLMRIISYDVVISAKQKVIREMETKMAIPGYTRELEILNTGALSFFTNLVESLYCFQCYFWRRSSC